MMSSRPFGYLARTLAYAVLMATVGVLGSVVGAQWSPDTAAERVATVGALLLVALMLAFVDRPGHVLRLRHRIDRYVTCLRVLWVLSVVALYAQYRGLGSMSEVVLPANVLIVSGAALREWNRRKRAARIRVLERGPGNYPLSTGPFSFEAPGTGDGEDSEKPTTSTVWRRKT
jgi:hypothetical protein